MTKKTPIKNCRDCALWIQKKTTFPRRGICVNTKMHEYEGGGCWKFVDRRGFIKTIDEYKRECGNCSYDRCTEVALYEGKAVLCKNYLNKASIKRIKENEKEKK